MSLSTLRSFQLPTTSSQALALLPDKDTTRIFAIGMGSGVVLYLLASKGPQEMVRSLIGSVLGAARLLPGVSNLLDQAEVSALQGIIDDLAPIDPSSITELSSKGESAAVIAQLVKDGLAKDLSHGFLEGRSFAGIYHYPVSELSQLQASVMTECLNTNALYPSVFKSVKKMEAESVMMIVSMLKGILGLPSDPNINASDYVDPAPNACGMLASGGTESILLAVKSYRDAFLTARGLNTTSAVTVTSSSGNLSVGEAATFIQPEVIAAITCHPALDKACDYLRLKLIKLPTNPVTQTLEPSLVEKVITANTAFIYSSAPTFPHGVVDPIPELAALAQKHSIGLHVDNCLGGVLLSYAYELQQRESVNIDIPNSMKKIPSFDFRVPGVTSISTDIHKYGYAPKGASVIAFRNEEMRRYVYSVVSDWPGGLYTTPTSTGSRSGANAAAAWATLRYMGGEGYSEMAKLNQSLLERLYTFVKQELPQLTIVGQTQASIFAFTIAGNHIPFNIYSLAARMEKKGYHMNSLQSPPAIMLCISERFSDQIDEWMQALRDCVHEAMMNPKDPEYEGKGEAGIYGASAVLPAKEIGRILKRYCDILYMIRKK